MTKVFTTVERIDICDSLITVTTPDRKWFYFWFVPETVRRYRGSGTVWYDADTGRRQNTGMESFLCDVWTKHKWTKP